MRGVTLKTPERVAEAQHMRGEGKLLREIAEYFGISKTTAHQWLTDPDGSLMARRRERYMRTCEECGGRVHWSAKSNLCAGCSIDAVVIWTPDAIAFAIQEWADEHGGIPPSANEARAAHARDPSTFPNVNHVRYRWGTWNAAIRAAGFEPHHSGPLGGFTPLTPEQRDECARRYADGESTVVIAADLGCSPRIVAKWARRAGVAIRDPFGRRAA